TSAPSHFFSSCLSCPVSHRDPRSFPTRRSSDLCSWPCPATSPPSPNWPGSPPCTSHRSPRPTRRPCWTTRPTAPSTRACGPDSRSEEHTSELQSRENLVCRLLLEKKNNT